jgi:hypothetical protein
VENYGSASHKYHAYDSRISEVITDWRSRILLWPCICVSSFPPCWNSTDSKSIPRPSPLRAYHQTSPSRSFPLTLLILPASSEKHSHKCAPKSFNLVQSRLLVTAAKRICNKCLAICVRAPHSCPHVSNQMYNSSPTAPLLARHLLRCGELNLCDKFFCNSF